VDVRPYQCDACAQEACGENSAKKEKKKERKKERKDLMTVIICVHNKPAERNASRKQKKTRLYDT